jgi:cytoskeletal protein RodZ
MKTIGEVIREARERKKLSLYAIEQKTKIKKEFVAAIEAEKWEKLPEYPVVIGFVKSLAGVLGISERQVVAVLRRDYPPKSLTVNPKPDVVREFVWSPRLTFYLGVGIIVILTVGYLAFQYKKFVSPPDLVVY